MVKKKTAPLDIPKQRSKASLIREVLEERGMNTPTREVREKLAEDGRVFTDSDIDQQRKRSWLPRSTKVTIPILKRVKALQDEAGGAYQLKALITKIREIGSLAVIEAALDVLEELA